jgi:hypothetical protein
LWNLQMIVMLLFLLHILQNIEQKNQQQGIYNVRMAEKNGSRTPYYFQNIPSIPMIE